MAPAWESMGIVLGGISLQESMHVPYCPHLPFGQQNSHPFMFLRTQGVSDKGFTRQPWLAAVQMYARNQQLNRGAHAVTCCPIRVLALHANGEIVCAAFTYAAQLSAKLKGFGCCAGP